MGKTFLISILAAGVAIPVFAARDRNERRGLKRTLFFLLLFDVVYVVLLLFVYSPSHVPPPPPP
jgi:hypothetical protein